MEVKGATVIDVGATVDASADFGTEALHDSWDDELTNLVAANADVIVRCPWLGDAEMELSPAINSIQVQLTPENVDMVVAEVHQMLARAAEENAEEEETIADDEITDNKPKPKAEANDTKSAQESESIGKTDAPKRIIKTSEKANEKIVTPASDATAENSAQVAAKNISATTQGAEKIERNAAAKKQTATKPENVQTVARTTVKPTSHIPKKPTTKVTQDPIAEKVYDIDTPEHGGEKPVIKESPIDKVELIIPAEETMDVEEIMNPEQKKTKEPTIIETAVLNEIKPEMTSEDMVEFSNMSTTDTETNTESNQPIEVDATPSFEEVTTQIVNKVYDSEPEDQAKIYEIIEQITEYAATQNRGEMDETESHQELEDLFAELLDILEIDYTPELIDDLAKTTIRWSSVPEEISFITEKDEPETEDQNHAGQSAKPKQSAFVNDLKKVLAQAYAIGRSTLKLCSLSS
jgi:hypothetical protein